VGVDEEEVVAIMEVEASQEIMEFVIPDQVRTLDDKVKVKVMQGSLLRAQLVYTNFPLWSFRIRRWRWIEFSSCICRCFIWRWIRWIEFSSCICRCVIRRWIRWGWIQFSILFCFFLFF
jgi:hypothetical protein